MKKTSFSTSARISAIQEHFAFALGFANLLAERVVAVAEGFVEDHPDFAGVDLSVFAKHGLVRRSPSGASSRGERRENFPVTEKSVIGTDAPMTRIRSPILESGLFSFRAR